MVNHLKNHPPGQVSADQRLNYSIYQRRSSRFKAFSKCPNWKPGISLGLKACKMDRFGCEITPVLRTRVNQEYHCMFYVALQATGLGLKSSMAQPYVSLAQEPSSFLSENCG